MRSLRRVMSPIWANVRAAAPTRRVLRTLGGIEQSERASTIFTTPVSTPGSRRLDLHDPGVETGVTVATNHSGCAGGPDIAHPIRVLAVVQHRRDGLVIDEGHDRG